MDGTSQRPEDRGQPTHILIRLARLLQRRKCPIRVEDRSCLVYELLVDINLPDVVCAELIVEKAPICNAGHLVGNQPNAAPMWRGDGQRAAG